MLLPALASLPQPLALHEVGAAAGLTLIPDVYSYEYGGLYRVAGTDPAAPLLSCRPLGYLPLPNRAPEVAWRAGIDLNPLDPNNDDDMAWLSCLLWPGETDRAERLEGAIGAARRQPPRIYRGDLLDDLARVAARAPADATLVVYHSAVLAYVDPPRRRAFGVAVRELGAVWLSNEGDGVLPGVATGPGPACFLLVRDGEEVMPTPTPTGPG